MPWKQNWMTKRVTGTCRVEMTTGVWGSKKQETEAGARRCPPERREDEVDTGAHVPFLEPAVRNTEANINQTLPQG
eukprot:2730527-Pyramimonas_sp.AAC.2